MTISSEHQMNEENSMSENKASANPKNQGEGNRDAAAAYNDAQQAFVREGKVDEKAGERRNMSAQERREAEQAEREGESHAREKDPSVVRDYHERRD
jgi:hypothetical protein